MFAIIVIGVILAIGIANFARTRFEEASRLGAKTGAPEKQTAAEVAREFLDAADAGDVKIAEHNGLVTDYFDASRRTLFLHRDVMNGASLTAWAVALHEAAHATQGGASRKALEWRMTCIRATRYLPTLIAVACLALGFLKRLPWPMGFRIIALSWFIIMLLNAMSLPIEFNASQRALAFLERKLRKHPALLEQIELVLKGIAWRDTAAFLRSPVYCLFGALPVGGALRPR